MSRKEYRSLDRTMSVDIRGQDTNQTRVMSVDSAASTHLWAHGNHISKSRPDISKVTLSDKKKSKAPVRQYIVLARVSRRSWPTSSQYR